MQAEFSVRVRDELSELHFFILSDVWLDHPQTMEGLQKTFDNCIENNFIPKVIVLCGNFTTRSLAHGNSRDIQGYQGLDQHYYRNFPIIYINLCRQLRCTG
jgi:DNA polymerase epsilon subunit 2